MALAAAPAPGESGGGPERCEAGGWLGRGGLERLRGSASTAVLRLDLPGCEDCPKLDPLWDLFWEHFPARAWRVDCGEDPALCAPFFAGPLASAGGGKAPPVIKVSVPRRAAACAVAARAQGRCFRRAYRWPWSQAADPCSSALS